MPLKPRNRSQPYIRKTFYNRHPWRNYFHHHYHNHHRQDHNAYNFLSLCASDQYLARDRANTCQLYRRSRAHACTLVCIFPRLSDNSSTFLRIHVLRARAFRAVFFPHPTTCYFLTRLLATMSKL